MVNNAITFDERSKATIADEMRGLTGIDNPNSVSQMKSWLSDQGIEAESLGKKAIAEMIKDASEDLAQVLSLRQQLAKSSVKKYQAMQNAACNDHRTRGMFQFYGANRTGRWAGRLIQLQNLPQNHMDDLDSARELVRTAFIAKPGYKFYVADFSAIEARVIAHLAGESWRAAVINYPGASTQVLCSVPTSPLTELAISTCYHK